VIREQTLAMPDQTMTMSSSGVVRCNDGGTPFKHASGADLRRNGPLRFG
jgi:hypothetical protein